MKLVLLPFMVLLFSQFSLAQGLNCEVSEFLNSETKKQTLVVQSNPQDPHGGLLTFQGQTFPEVSGFVSLLNRDGKYFAVLSMYSEKLNSNASGQYQMVAQDQYAQLQLIIPSDSNQLAGLEILCQFDLK